MKQCPLLSACNLTTGIDCKDRNFKECEFFQNSVRSAFDKTAHRYLDTFPKAAYISVFNIDGKAGRTVRRK